MRHPPSTLQFCLQFCLCRNGASFHKTVKQTGVGIRSNKLLLVQTLATQETKYPLLQLCVLWKSCTSCQSLNMRSDRKIPRNNRCGYRRVGECMCLWWGGGALYLISKQYIQMERSKRHLGYVIFYFLLPILLRACCVENQRRKRGKEKGNPLQDLILL